MNLDKPDPPPPSHACASELPPAREQKQDDRTTSHRHRQGAPGVITARPGRTRLATGSTLMGASGYALTLNALTHTPIYTHTYTHTPIHIGLHAPTRTPGADPGFVEGGGGAAATAFPRDNIAFPRDNIAFP